jgi:hypothetical protein
LPGTRRCACSLGSGAPLVALEPRIDLGRSRRSGVGRPRAWPVRSGPVFVGLAAALAPAREDPASVRARRPGSGRVCQRLCTESRRAPDLGLLPGAALAGHHGVLESGGDTRGGRAIGRWPADGDASVDRSAGRLAARRGGVCRPDGRGSRRLVRLGRSRRVGGSRHDDVREAVRRAAPAGVSPPGHRHAGALAPSGRSADGIAPHNLCPDVCSGARTSWGPGTRCWMARWVTSGGGKLLLLAGILREACGALYALAIDPLDHLERTRDHGHALLGSLDPV